MAVINSVSGVDSQRINQIRYPVVDTSEITMSSHGIVEEAPPPREVEEDKIYVAVGKDLKESQSTLLWALRNSGGRQICILHVHQPAEKIPGSQKLLGSSMLHLHRLPFLFFLFHSVVFGPLLTPSSPALSSANDNCTDRDPRRLFQVIDNQVREEIMDEFRVEREAKKQGEPVTTHSAIEPPSAIEVPSFLPSAIAIEPNKAKDCRYFRWVDEEPTIETYKDLLVKMHSDMKDMEDEMYLMHSEIK
ncbi:hypothetical protein LXL04_009695 [Taraxacum kok-saghyz]